VWELKHKTLEKLSRSLSNPRILRHCYDSTELGICGTEICEVSRRGLAKLHMVKRQTREELTTLSCFITFALEAMFWTISLKPEKTPYWQLFPSILIHSRGDIRRFQGMVLKNWVKRTKAPIAKAYFTESGTTRAQLVLERLFGVDNQEIWASKTWPITKVCTTKSIRGVRVWEAYQTNALRWLMLTLLSSSIQRANPLLSKLRE